MSSKKLVFFFLHRVEVNKTYRFIIFIQFSIRCRGKEEIKIQCENGTSKVLCHVGSVKPFDWNWNKREQQSGLLFLGSLKTVDFKTVKFMPKICILTWTTFWHAMRQLFKLISVSMENNNIHHLDSDRKSFYIFNFGLFFFLVFCFRKNYYWNAENGNVFWLLADNLGEWMFVKVSKRARLVKRVWVEGKKKTLKK